MTTVTTSPPFEGNWNIGLHDVVTGYDNHEVLHDVSVQSHDNVTCLFGPNGSGKSTLLKALAGALPVWEGSVWYEGEDVTGVSTHQLARSGVATVPQDGGLFGSMSAKENLLVGAHGVDDDAVIERRMAEVFDAFPPIEDKLSAQANALSGGQQMMLAFGCAMMSGADTFLLDEPTAGLAPALVDDTMDMIGTLADRDAHVVLVEQNVTAGLRSADYVYILAKGEIQFGGPPSDLSDEDELINLYLGI